MSRKKTPTTKKTPTRRSPRPRRPEACEPLEVRLVDDEQPEPVSQQEPVEFVAAAQAQPFDPLPDESADAAPEADILVPDVMPTTDPSNDEGEIDALVQLVVMAHDVFLERRFGCALQPAERRVLETAVRKALQVWLPDMDLPPWVQALLLLSGAELMIFAPRLAAEAAAAETEAQ